jgi:putative SOS response-associated peptidase YedK
MTTHYEPLSSATDYPDAFNVEAPRDLGGHDMWPRKPGVFICKTESVAETEGQRTLMAGKFGLVPSWVKSASDAKLRSPKLVTAFSDVVTTSNNFRESWLANQRCIVPMMAFYAEDWRSGKAVQTRISRIDGKPMGVAGLWSRWGSGENEIISFTLLMVNANSHALMHRYQQPGSEKRMVVVLNEGAYDAWLSVRHEKAKEFMRAYPSNWLAANPAENKADKVPQGLMG